MRAEGRPGTGAADIGRALAQELNQRMAAAGASSIPGRRGSAIRELQRGYDGAPRIVWNSNGVSVSVVGNTAATDALLEESHHFVSQLERLDAATAEAARLLARMRAAGVGSIAAPSGSAFTRIVDTGHAWGLQFTWRSNGATCCFRGNVHAAPELLPTAGSFDAALDAQERRQRALAQRGASALERLRGDRGVG